MQNNKAEFLRFLLVGGSGAAGYVVFAWAMRAGLGLPPFWASVIAYALMIGPVYLAQRLFTFESQASHRQTLWRYVAIQVASMLIAGVASYVFALIVRSPFEFLLANVVSALFGYVSMKFWAFRPAVGQQQS